jgi:hypothetical protein
LLATGLIFSSASANKGLTTFGGIGGFAKAEQAEVMHTVIQEWITDPSFLPTLKKWNPAVDAKTVSPFVSSNSGPNMISVIHLIAQSIVCEHVCPSKFSSLIAQEAMTYELFEVALNLPAGFVSGFGEEKAKGAKKNEMKEMVMGFLRKIGWDV